MRRRIRDFHVIKVDDDLEGLIEALASVRSSLPPEAEARVALRGDDVFGRFISVSYLRAQTDEELAADCRYATDEERAHCVSEVRRAA